MGADFDLGSHFKSPLEKCFPLDSGPSSGLNSWFLGQSNLPLSSVGQASSLYLCPLGVSSSIPDKDRADIGRPFDTGL